MMIKRYKRAPLKPRVLLNNRIPFSEIIVIDDQGQNLGTYDLESALSLARSKNLDLICINSDAKPPICKIVNYDRYRFTQQKKVKPIQQKKMRITPAIGDNDLKIKAKQCRKFLSQKHKVKVTMRLRGREKYLKAYGRDKLQLFVDQVMDLCRPLKPWKLINNQYQLVFEPK